LATPPTNGNGNSRAARVGAVVVGGDFHGLAIARSLGRHGVPICFVDDELSIGRFSKYCTFSVRAPNLHDEKQIVDFLLELGRNRHLQGWVLFPTRDELVAAFSRNKASLSELFRVPTPEWEITKWAWNKWNTYSLAAKLGIPIPRTWCPRTVEDLDKIDAEFPLGIKPSVKEDFFYATKAKAWRANNREELKALFQKALGYVGQNEVLVQEIIPGDGTCQFSSCLFVKDGVAIGSMEAQRWRQHPPEFGRAATFVESVSLPVVEEPSLKFLRAINYYGLAEVEYKLDVRDGKYKLLDVNARTWGFHALGCSAGVDFCYLLYADQVGELVEACHGRSGVGWIRMVTDLPTSFAGIFAGRLTAKDYLQSLKDFQVESVFSSDDIAPTLAEIALLPYLAIKRGY
jgi:predicted ATP-grasp superfamily ATP-dependent carboligase